MRKERTKSRKRTKIVKMPEIDERKLGWLSSGPSCQIWSRILLKTAETGEVGSLIFAKFKLDDCEQKWVS